MSDILGSEYYMTPPLGSIYGALYLQPCNTREYNWGPGNLKVELDPQKIDHKFESNFSDYQNAINICLTVVLRWLSKKHQTW